jgi:hypothetical protein
MRGKGALELFTIATRAWTRIIFLKLILNKFSPLNPPLKKAGIGGFALIGLAKIPPSPPLQRGEILFQDKLLIFRDLCVLCDLCG